ncbi:sensor histidine kinase [Demequina phytophila]|uniref:sensor histidine kinase n=1 Tax=Demequina phytophila TaxID=1638981 RepID=UPI0007818553|nr:histidine kinase [Demequina phytophila]
MTSLIARLPRPASERGRDAVGAAVVALVILAITVADDGAAGLVTFEFAGAVVACAALAWRRSADLWVLAAVGAVFVAVSLATGSVANALLPLLVAVYTVASRSAHIPVALAIGALAVIGVGGTVALSTGVGPSDSVVVSGEIWVALAVVIGIAMNLYRRSLAQERERARQAEATRDALARTKVAEERLRIARELHDAVGHHIAVMNVQAGVAEALLESSPDRAAEALGRVQDAGARVLEELPVMLRVLRQGEDEDSHPVAGLAAVGELLEQARDAGLDVTYERRDLHVDLPAATDHAAYRIVQEALSNARRYGTGHADVTVTADASSLVIEVRNAASGAHGEGSGFGLVGMRERASAAGGTVDAVPDGDEFVVRAELPTRGGGER